LPSQNSGQTCSRVSLCSTRATLAQPGLRSLARRSTRKPGYRGTRRRCWLRRHLQQRSRRRSDQERHFDGIWRQGRWWFVREKGMLRWRLIDDDLNRLRQESVFCKCHRLVFDSQREGARCLARLARPGAHIGAAWHRLELQGLRQRRRWFPRKPIKQRRRASREGTACRRRDSNEHKCNAGHDRLGPERVARLAPARHRASETQPHTFSFEYGKCSVNGLFPPARRGGSCRSQKFVAKPHGRG
jgi:hypothetical protein